MTDNDVMLGLSRFLLELHWWVYLCIVFSVFSVCLVLNYIVKKVNEAKLEERFARMRVKPRTQTTEIQGNTDLEANRANTVTSKPPPTLPGISLVFSRDQNNDVRKRHVEATLNLIKNSTEAKTHEPIATNSLPEIKATASTKVSQHSALNTNESSIVTKKKSAELITLKDSKAVSSFDKIEEDIGPSNYIQSVLETTVIKQSRTVLNAEGAVTVTSNNTRLSSSQQSKPIEPPIQHPSQRSLMEWIKDWIVPSVSKDDLNLPPKSSSNSNK